MTQEVTVYFNEASDFAELQRKENGLQNTLHQEAWLHHLRGENEAMLEKKKMAKRALNRERCYANLQRAFASIPVAKVASTLNTGAELLAP